MCKMKKSISPGGIHIQHEIKRREPDWTVQLMRNNCLLNHVLKERHRGEQKWEKDEEEDVSRVWTTLRKREGILNWKRKQWIALCGELGLEQAVGHRGADCEWMKLPSAVHICIQMFHYIRLRLIFFLTLVKDGTWIVNPWILDRQLVDFLMVEPRPHKCYCNFASYLTVVNNRKWIFKHWRLRGLVWR